MKRTKLWILSASLVLLHGCVDKENREQEHQDAGRDSQTKMPNPASVYCEEHDGTVKIYQDEQGNEYGLCVFSNGKECEEWAFFRGECDPNNNIDAHTQPDVLDDEIVVGIPNPASVNCSDLGGSLEMREVDAGQLGVCVFPGGAMCEEWALFRGECSADAPNFCESDFDCACGVHGSTRDCFVGQKEFVDITEQCPDFCTGIAGDFTLKCSQFKCIVGR